MNEIRAIKCYGCYFLADSEADYYLMVDTLNDKCRLIDAECFGIIELLNDIKNDIKEL